MTLSLFDIHLSDKKFSNINLIVRTFFLFKDLKRHLKGKRFSSDENLREVLKEVMFFLFSYALFFIAKLRSRITTIPSVYLAVNFFVHKTFNNINSIYTFYINSLMYYNIFSNSLSWKASMKNSI